MNAMEPTDDQGAEAGERLRRICDRAVGLEKRVAKLERTVARQTEDLLLQMDELIEELTALGAAPQMRDARREASAADRRSGRQRRSGARGGEALTRQTSEEKLLRELALSGVSRCNVKRAADGTWWARVGDHRPFTLSPALAQLLLVLSLDNNASDDHLVGWKSIGEVARLLRKRAANEANGEQLRTVLDPKREAHCVRQGLHRLRRALLANKVNHKLVMVSRALGARFGLRRGGRP